MQPHFTLAPDMAMSDAERITYFGLTDARNKRTPFGIKKKDRDRHTYVIGKTGMGKSTLLENMAVQDIQSGEGLCFIDPHGSTAEKLMDYIPEERVKDVLYFAPFDLEYPISFNVLENVDADKRHFVVAGLMSTFEKIWVDAWSARMAYILQNTLAALLEFPGATLLGVNRMYIDKEYRKNVIAKITDPSVRSFWVDEYSKYTDRYTQEATPAIQNKIGQFAANALVRNIIGQERSAFDIRELMDKKKIFIVNLSKGRVGEGNANLLGSMLITKVYLAAMSRADVPSSELRQLPYFYLYVDEFQNFANRSFADILSEARKYKLALTIAHQYVEQMEEEVAAAVFGNVGTMMAFRVGAYDAEVLEKEFAPTFMMEDLVNLGARQIYLKLMIDGISSQPFSAVTMPPIPEPTISHHDMAVAYSRSRYAQPRAEVERAIGDWVARKYEDPEAEEKEKARLERRALRDAEGGVPSASPDSAQRQPTTRTGETRVMREYRPSTTDDRRRAPQPFTTSPRALSSERPLRPARAEEPVARVYRPGVQAPRTERSMAHVQPPATTQQKQPDLRDILARISKQADAQHQNAPGSGPARQEQSPRSAVPNSAVRPEAPRVIVPPRGAQPPLAPVRDNGKGITPEGRESLKELLAAVAKNSTTQEKERPVAASERATPPSTPSSRPEGDQGTGHAPEQRTQPREIDENELRALLHVDKPSIST